MKSIVHSTHLYMYRDSFRVLYKEEQDQTIFLKHCIHVHGYFHFIFLMFNFTKIEHAQYFIHVFNTHFSQIVKFKKTHNTVFFIVHVK